MLVIKVTDCLNDTEVIASEWQRIARMVETQLQPPGLV